MLDPLLTLGSFSFYGLESPERIHLKSRQRIAVHHLGSGQSITDCLGDDCELVDFRGIFSGKDAAERIRAVDYIRLEALPVSLTWGSQVLSVLISQFELDYVSDFWVLYKLSCRVVRSTDPNVDIQADPIFASPLTQIDDLLGLLQGTGASPTSKQIAAVSALSALDFDTPPPATIAEALSLVSLIDEQLTQADNTSPDANLPAYPNSPTETHWITNTIAGFGMEASLILARNRTVSVIISADGLNQQ